MINMNSSNSNYSNISCFGSNVQSPTDNPLTYCVGYERDILSLHSPLGYVIRPGSKKCQAFMSDYCAKNWDGICEVESHNQSHKNPNIMLGCSQGQTNHCPQSSLSEGEALIYNSAVKKYMVDRYGCAYTYQPFDPTVASSPLVRYMNDSCCQQAQCVPIYEVNPREVNSDPIMHKLLTMVHIGPDILLNIFNTARRTGKLQALMPTKLGVFFRQNAQFFKSNGRGKLSPLCTK